MRLPLKLRWLDLWVSAKELSRLGEQQEQRPCEAFHGEQQGDSRGWHGEQEGVMRWAQRALGDQAQSMQDLAGTEGLGFYSDMARH